MHQPALRRPLLDDDLTIAEVTPLDVAMAPPLRGTEQNPQRIPMADEHHVVAAQPRQLVEQDEEPDQKIERNEQEPQPAPHPLLSR